MSRSESTSISLSAWSGGHWQLAGTLRWNLDRVTRVGTVSTTEKNLSQMTISWSKNQYGHKDSGMFSWSHYWGCEMSLLSLPSLLTCVQGFVLNCYVYNFLHISLLLHITKLRSGLKWLCSDIDQHLVNWFLKQILEQISVVSQTYLFLPIQGVFLPVFLGSTTTLNRI